MITILFLKGLSDLGFVYAIFSPLWAILSIEKPLFYLTWMLQALAYTLSYQLNKKGNLRYLPFLLCFLPPVLFPGIKSLLFVLPGTIYGFYYAYKQYYQLQSDQQIAIFGRFWKLAAALAAVTLILGRYDIVVEWTIIISLIVASAQILLMRALRHDPAVYLKPSYQLTDMGIMALLALLVSFLSSDTLRTNVLGAICFFYFTLVVPVLLFIIRIITYILAYLIVPIQRLIFKNRTQESDIKLITESAKEMLQVEENELNTTAMEVVKYTLIGIGLIIAVIIVIMLFRFLSPGQREKEGQKRAYSTRTHNVRERKKREAEPESEFSAQVRERYRAFLKLYKKRRLPLTRSSTSGDIQRSSLLRFDGKASSRLRELYIEARYGDAATAQSAEEAKELLKKLKEKDTQKDPEL